MPKTENIDRYHINTVAFGKVNHSLNTRPKFKTGEQITVVIKAYLLKKKNDV